MKKSRLALLCLSAYVFVIALFPAQAQNGWNAVVHSNSGSTIATVGSYDLVDASVFSGGNLCQQIYNVFVSYNNTNANGIVIDARGISGSALTCSSVNPWAYLTGSYGPFANVVLLPAGTITIQTTWELPDNTVLVGEGPTATTIAAASGLTGDMIDMGNESGSFGCDTSPADCPGIVIEHLALNGNGSVNGIVNCCAQELSRVTDVLIENATTGLNISDKYAENSGPYSNLKILNVNTCLSIGPGATAGIPNTRGVHGLNCSVNSGTTPAITIDSPNNTLEDITISGSTNQDGILIGSQAAAQSNTLYNVQGTGLKNVIHISGTTPSNASNCPNTKANVCDITMAAISNSGSTTTIQDDLISTTQGIQDSTVALYVVGEAVQNIASGSTSNIGYSRFTTATVSGNTPTWLVGSTAPTSSCAVGTLYSCTGTSTQCTSGSFTGTIWECVGGSTPWKKIQ
jgi:hypothetical protein